MCFLSEDRMSLKLSKAIVTLFTRTSPLAIFVLIWSIMVYWLIQCQYWKAFSLSVARLVSRPSKRSSLEYVWKNFSEIMARNIARPLSASHRLVAASPGTCTHPLRSAALRRRAGRSRPSLSIRRRFFDDPPDLPSPGWCSLPLAWRTGGTSRLRHGRRTSRASWGPGGPYSNALRSRWRCSLSHLHDHRNQPSTFKGYYWFGHTVLLWDVTVYSTYFLS